MIPLPPVEIVDGRASRPVPSLAALGSRPLVVEFYGGLVGLPEARRTTASLRPVYEGVADALFFHIDTGPERVARVLTTYPEVSRAARGYSQAFTDLGVRLIFGHPSADEVVARLSRGLAGEPYTALRRTPLSEAQGARNGRVEEASRRSVVAPAAWAAVRREIQRATRADGPVASLELPASLRELVVVGHSAGAYSAFDLLLSLARRRPDLSVHLVLLAPACEASFAERRVAVLAPAFRAFDLKILNLSPEDEDGEDLLLSGLASVRMPRPDGTIPNVRLPGGVYLGSILHVVNAALNPDRRDVLGIEASLTAPSPWPTLTALRRNAPLSHRSRRHVGFHDDPTFRRSMRAWLASLGG